MQKQISYKKWFWVGGVFLLAIAFWLVATYGFISVQIVGAKSDSRVKVELYNQSNKSSTVIQTGNGQAKRFTAKADYEIRVSQSDYRSVVVSKSKGFFGTTNVSVKLVPQQARSFAGYSPNGCMFSTSEAVYSTDCGNDSSITYHVPATSNQPTYNQKKELGFGKILSTTQTPAGTVALTAPVSADEEDSQIRGPGLLLLKGTTVVANSTLADTDQSRQYNIKSFRDGFIVYDDTFGWVRYFSSVNAKPQTINLGKPTNDEQKPLTINTSGSTILASYSDKADYQDNTDPKGVGKVNNSVMLYSGNQSRELKFKKQFNTVISCGVGNICGLDTESRQLLVYSIRDEPDLVYHLDDVDGLWGEGKSVLFSRSGGIYNLDVPTQSAKGILAINSYSSCGVTIEKSGALICQTSPGGKSTIFRLSGNGVSDDIESKLEELLQENYVKDVSIYGKYIMITPAIGEAVYPSAAGGLDYNPVTKEKALKAINQAIGSAGIDRRNYSITVIGL